jgi:hypothetical protein
MPYEFAPLEAEYRRFAEDVRTTLDIEAGLQAIQPADLGPHIDAMTAHINELLNELGPPPGWAPDQTEGA